MITVQKLANLDEDIESTGDAINEDMEITSRLGLKFDSIPRVIRKSREQIDDVVQEIRIRGGYFKTYNTLVEANADIANIPLDATVKVSNEVNGGDYYKETLGSTSLTKSHYDPYQLGKDFTIEQADKIRLESLGEKADLNALFLFEDSDGKVVVIVKPDGNIITSKTDLFRMSSEIKDIGYTVEKTVAEVEEVQKSIVGEKADLNALFLFEDSDGKVVVIVKPDGNIITSKLNLHELKSAADFLTQFNSSIEESDGKVSISELNENLFEFEDATGKKVITFKKSGVVQLNNETNISRTSINSGEISAGIFQKEYAESDYLNLNLQRLLLSNVSTLSPFVGSHKQQFSIKNTSEFLNLKISQGDEISIDTPYYKKDSHVFSNQVVHPYICKFQKTVMGYKWIMLITPFHSTIDMYENPCVYGSNDLKNFELLDTFEQPLMGLLPTGEYNYNSDPSCVFDHGTGEFCVISRNTQATSGSSLYVLRTKDFVDWGEPELMDIEDGLSPSIMFDTSINKWVLYSYRNNTSFSRKVAEKLEGPWVVSDVKTPPFNVWHQEIRFCGTHYVGVFGDNRLDTGGAFYLGISADGLNWQFSGDIFEGAHFPAYKPSITHEFVDSTHIKFHIVWTSSDISGVLNEKWKLFSAETQPIEVI